MRCLCVYVNKKNVKVCNSIHKLKIQKQVFCNDYFMAPWEEWGAIRNSNFLLLISYYSIYIIYISQQISTTDGGGRYCPRSRVWKTKFRGIKTQDHAASKRHNRDLNLCFTISADVVLLAFVIGEEPRN